MNLSGAVNRLTQLTQARQPFVPLTSHKRRRPSPAVKPKAKAKPKTNGRPFRRAKGRTSDVERDGPSWKYRRLEANEAQASGRITQIYFPKLNSDGKGASDQEIVYPCFAIVVIGGSKWKGDGFLSLDKHLFTHDVRGTVDERSDPRFGVTYQIENLETRSLRFTPDTQEAMFASLLKASFSEDTKGSLWQPLDLDNAREAIRSIVWPGTTQSADWDMSDSSSTSSSSSSSEDEEKKTQQKPFQLEDWLEQHKASPWAQVMRDSELVQTYLVCLHWAKLLQYYPLRHIQELNVRQRSALLKQVDADPYPLFFYDLYRDQYACLPELRLTSLDVPFLKRFSMEQLHNIWLYSALCKSEEASGNTVQVVDIKRVRGKRPRRLISFAGCHKTILQDFHRAARERIDFVAELHAAEMEDEKIVPSVRDLPSLTHGDFGPILDRLFQQGSLVLLGVPESQPYVEPVLTERIMIRKSFTRNMAIVQLLFNRQARYNPRALRTSSDEGVSFVERIKWDKDWHSKWMKPGPEQRRLWTSLGQELSQPYRTTVLCEEQKQAMEMIRKNPISMVLGPGGSGKTEIIVHAQGEIKIEDRREYLSLEPVPAPVASDVKDMTSATPSLLSRSKMRVQTLSHLQPGATGSDQANQMSFCLPFQKLIQTPTGRAAEEVHRRTKLPAFTSASVLVYSRQETENLLHGTDSKAQGTRNRIGMQGIPGVGGYTRVYGRMTHYGPLASGKFASVRFLVVDEFGLVGEESAFEILEWAAILPDLENIVFMGDPHQLESVDAGQVLLDFVKSGAIPKTILRQNHRVTPEAKLLAKNLMAISSGDPLRIETQPRMFTLTSAARMPLPALFQRHKGHFDECQIVCFTRECRDQLNQFFMDAHGFVSSNAHDLFVGQKIVFTKNLNKKNFSVRNGQPEIITRIVETDTDGLFRLLRAPTEGKERVDHVAGEIELKNTLQEPDRKARRIVFCQSGFRFDLSKDLQRTIRPGYCVTLHTMQSASTKHSILWDDGARLFRQFVYTAASRAIQSFLYITEHGDPVETFAAAVRYRHPPRLTYLAEALRLGCIRRMLTRGEGHVLFQTCWMSQDMPFDIHLAQLIVDYLSFPV